MSTTATTDTVTTGTEATGSESAGDTTGPNATAPETTADASRQHEGRLRRILRAARRPRVFVPAVLIVALAATTGWFGYRYAQERHLDDLRASALTGAQQYTVDLATYDYRHVDDNPKKVLSESTPQFGEKYKDVAAKLADLLRNGQGTSTGKVDYAGVTSVDDHRAVVVVFLDQQIKNVVAPQGRTDASRMVVTLVRDGGRWLLDGAEPK
ncbi:hypothetical protein G4X40_02615 [Rhodococcus sp. D2-41]|uniref:Mce-associated membrane protein n=1 Tax=Speluncibacter jeojiensis TaxID=2710754 RepID=A0A9X4M223_9ACTN|nr:hypothetical protein [Rhodococcus sp. D2-41]MDG3009038.1 hypothetical protein [Rhodococcus sp. D2-41]MDG3015550.1 hypothetical protein [Corynebacteriales bacterium D3-21]